MSDFLMRSFRAQLTTSMDSVLRGAVFKIMTIFENSLHDHQVELAQKGEEIAQLKIKLQNAEVRLSENQRAGDGGPERKQSEPEKVLSRPEEAPDASEFNFEVPDDWCAPLGYETVVKREDSFCPSVRLRRLSIPLYPVPFLKQEVVNDDIDSRRRSSRGCSLNARLAHGEQEPCRPPAGNDMAKLVQDIQQEYTDPADGARPRRTRRRVTGKPQKSTMKRKKGGGKAAAAACSEKETKTNGRESTYSCKFCKKEFDTIWGRKVHVRSHKKCKGCKKEFRFPSALRSHKPFCKKLRALMAKQATSANPPKPQSPGVENLTAPSKETPAVNESVPSSNGRRESSTQKAESAKKHACTHCNMSFNSSTRLREHVRVHTGERPYLCSACPKKFAVKQALKKHMSRMHEGQADVSEAQADTSSNWKTVGTRCREGFICALCPRLLRTRFMLSEHFRTHTGEKPLKCEQCSATFRFRGQLSLHKKRCAGPQPVTECAKCQKTFATQARYLKHMSSFHKDRSFCKICGKVFLTKGRLRNHMERFHQ
ncbi:uncharacterized protein LOC120817793 [Gasterosteus aculeatus]